MDDIPGAGREYAQASRSRARHWRRVAFMLPLLLLVLFGCSPPWSCPQQPTKWTLYAGRDPDTGHKRYVEVDPADYQEALADPRASRTNMDIELAEPYIQRQVTEAIQAPSDDSSGSILQTGAWVRKFELTEEGTGEQKVNLANIWIQPWWRHGEYGKQHPLGGENLLKLEFVPYVITPDTIPDTSGTYSNGRYKRIFLLNEPDSEQEKVDSAAALRLEVYGLYSHPDEKAVCSKSGSSNSNIWQTIISRRVLATAYDSLARRRPIVLPTDRLTATADELLGKPGFPGDVPTKLVGMNVGSDHTLKIGFDLDPGWSEMGYDFTSATSTSRLLAGRSKIKQRRRCWI